MDFSLNPSAYVQEMTPEADIISTKYTKSVIKSSAALSYIEAQARMDDRYAFLSQIVAHLKIAVSIYMSCLVSVKRLLPRYFFIMHPEIPFCTHGVHGELINVPNSGSYLAFNLDNELSISFQQKKYLVSSL